jgi:hypothetical protein
VPTPFNTPFHVFTVRLSPPTFARLDELAREEGLNLGRILATMMMYGSALLDTPEGLRHFVPPEGLTNKS